ncbi:hypothetical protein D3C76_1136070 [compost metagenome]
MKVVAVAGATNTYQVIAEFNENLDVLVGSSAVKVSVSDGVDVKTSTTAASVDNKLIVQFTTDKDIKGKVVTLELNSSNANAKIVTDKKGNAADAFTQSVYIPE